MKQPIRIIVVDNHDFYRNTLIQQLSSNKDLKVIGEASNGIEFILLLKTKVPDIVLMDIKMPILDGLEAIKKGLIINNDMKIIALTMHESREHALKIIKAGAKGILLKNASVNEIEKTIYKVTKGEVYYSNIV